MCTYRVQCCAMCGRDDRCVFVIWRVCAHNFDLLCVCMCLWNVYVFVRRVCGVCLNVCVWRDIV